ncbi:Nucleotide-binding universal stress protein, UspA family [Paraburkholderia phenazinium]|jgi:nucleotide-binding universal stress UspA family protein|uniref:Nucleotide-binding universal stress protein, UspA family n=1 Tax=Paraburkholderia phenazinium TaxID=60549 RepID=A0A1G7YX78_9BURK|nr:universal stress protein [Paraburkholderia phenazinium]SDH01172.1 Nucleotide-binding universal stress protein, UspA family [Paraburkholderia phenazinium]
MFDIVLVPLDGAPQRAHVIDLAARAATPGSSTLHLLCVVDPSYAQPPGDPIRIEPSLREPGSIQADGLVYPYAVEQTGDAERILAAAAERLTAHGFAVERHVRAGAPGDVIVDEARRIAADVIVMGHRHLSRLRRWANPSTAGEVIEHAPCPVLVQTRDGGGHA